MFYCQSQYEVDLLFSGSKVSQHGCIPFENVPNSLCRISLYQHVSLKICNTSTTTKTWVTYGISHLAKLTPLCVDSARALWASFCFRYYIFLTQSNYTIAAFGFGIKKIFSVGSFVVGPFSTSAVIISLSSSFPLEYNMILTHCKDMLVASLRPAEHLTDLTQAEVSDLFSMVQRVSAVTQRQFSASAVTVAVQDGADAGQTVKVCTKCVYVFGCGYLGVSVGGVRGWEGGVVCACACMCVCVCVCETVCMYVYVCTHDSVHACRSVCFAFTLYVSKRDSKHEKQERKRKEKRWEI